MKKILCLSFALLWICSSLMAQKPWDNGKLKVSENGRYLQHENGTPFFWLGDTSWLLFQRLNREQVKTYLENRKAKGFNVIQCIFYQFYTDKNAYGDYGFADSDLTQPIHTPGNDPNDPAQYDYWDHADYVVDLAAEYGMYVAIVPTWSHLILRDKNMTVQKAEIFAAHLADHFKDRPNIIWINGGSAKPHVNTDIWNAIGKNLRKYDPNHLITFHTFGRMQSSEAFHNAEWLDLNMFTSGHRNYEQDDTEKGYGEDNWRYVLDDLSKKPQKPTIDGEPSYESLPQGLHDHSMPYWTDSDVRRYAYWSVFAGACGHVYGQNSVRQVYIEGVNKPESGAKISFFEALDDEGSFDMQYLKNLMLSRPYFDRVNAQFLLVDEGERYDRVLVTRGADYLMAYDYTGRAFTLKLGAIEGETLRVWWYDPTTGEAIDKGTIKNKGEKKFKAPKSKEHTDWVLVLDNASKKFGAPGAVSNK